MVFAWLRLLPCGLQFQLCPEADHPDWSISQLSSDPRQTPAKNHKLDHNQFHPHHSNSSFTNQLITSCHTQTYQLKALLNKQEQTRPEFPPRSNFTELSNNHTHNIHFQICLEAQYCLLLNLRYMFSKFTAMYILVICNCIWICTY